MEKKIEIISTYIHVFKNKNMIRNVRDNNNLLILIIIIIITTKTGCLLCCRCLLNKLQLNLINFNY